MADISKIKTPDELEYNIKDDECRTTLLDLTTSYRSLHNRIKILEDDHMPITKFTIHYMMYNA